MNFQDFRIVEAHKNSAIAHDPDGLLHLVEHERNFQTLCLRHAYRVTHLRFRDFGRPDPDAPWCEACVKRLAALEDPAAVKKERDRRRYRKSRAERKPAGKKSHGGQVKPETANRIWKVLILVDLGFTRWKAVRIVGIADSTVRNALRRMNIS